MQFFSVLCLLSAIFSSLHSIPVVSSIRLHPVVPKERRRGVVSDDELKPNNRTEGFHAESRAVMLGGEKTRPAVDLKG